MTQSNTFLAFVIAREDAGLLWPCISNLRRIGFEHVVVFCMEEFADEAERLGAAAINDATLEFVPVPSLPDDLSFLDLDNPYFAGPISRAQPDWIFAIDGDEFPVLEKNHISELKDIDDAHIVEVARFNHARQVDQGADAILRLLETPWRLPLIFKRRNALPDPESETETPRWLFHRIGPKVMIRPDAFRAFLLGTHGAVRPTNDDESPVKVVAKDMLIAHAPFTSFERFEGKINAAKSHIAQLPFMQRWDRAWHWKWWIKRQAEGALPAEFAREALSPDEMAALTTTGAVRTAAEIFAAWEQGATDD